MSIHNNPQDKEEFLRDFRVGDYRFMADRAELQSVRSELREEIARLQERMGNTATKEDISDLRGDLKEEFATLRGDLKSGIKSAENKNLRWFMGVIGIVAGLVSPPGTDLINRLF